MKRPLTGLVVAYASGIWVSSLTDWPAGVLLIVATGLFAAFLVLYRMRYSLVALLAFVFTAGAFGYRHATTVHSQNDIARLLEQRDQNVAMRGLIVSDTGYRADDTAATGEVDRISFRLRLRDIKHAGEWIPASGTVYVFVSEKRPEQALRYGDVIECSAILRVPPPARNPGTFDWRAWLARQNIHFTATIRKTDLCSIVEVERGNPVIALSLRLREQFEQALRMGLEKAPEVAGILAGMIIGERSEIPSGTYADFQHTGVFHVFAINGLHVGLVTGVVVIALRLLRMPKRWCGLAAIPLIVLYVFATGARPGAVRALVMASVWLIGWALVRPADSLNNLAAAALALLVWDPQQLFDGGFVLSFTVVLAIIVLVPRLEAAVKKRFAPDPFVPRPLVPGWERRLLFYSGGLLRLVCCSTAAFIGLVPLMATYFHLFAPVSIVANVLVVPLLGVILALGMVGMLVHAVWPWLTLTLNNANLFLLGVMTHGVDWLGRVPFGHWFVQTPPVWLTVTYYALGILLLSRAITWPRKRIVAALATPAIGAVIFLSFHREEVVEITALDLSDGTATFINMPGERADMLIDGGGDWSGQRVVVPFLRAQGVDRLAATVLTRADKPHVAGLSDVVRDIPVASAIHSGRHSRSRFYTQWLDDVKALHIPARTVNAGDDISGSPRVHIRVLYPSAGKTSTRSADNSLVLALEHGPTRVLLMSDAGETVEKALLASGVDLRAQVIIKGRHEQEPSATDAFLDAVQPEVVIQSVSARWPYRYPSSNTRDQLEARGVRVLRTDDCGAITVRLAGDGYTIRTCLRQ